MSLPGRVVSLSKASRHDFSKPVVASVALMAGEGVVGDVHSGRTVQHRSRVAIDPNQPNLRQVHLIARELLDELSGRGFALNPGDLGENILTSGLDLVALPCGTRLCIGDDAILELTGLRNPCAQIERFMPGLLAQVVSRRADGTIDRRAGVMAIVVAGGRVAVGDSIAVTLPSLPHVPLDRV